MGKASSNKKVARAARAGGKGKASGTKASWLWPASIAVVVVLGVVLIVLSRSEDASAEHPTFDDHWHEAYGVYVCDAYLPQFPDNVQSGGIHTHNDGLMHVEPRSALDTGKNANVGRFADGVGLELSEDSIKLPDGTEYKTGDKCGDEKGTVRYLRDGKPYKGDPNDSLLEDGHNFAIVFAPADKEIPEVPFIKNLDDPLAGETGTAEVTIPPAGGATTTAPPEGTTDTSTPAAGTDTTDTSAPAAEGGDTSEDPASTSTTSAP